MKLSLHTPPPDSLKVARIQSLPNAVSLEDVSLRPVMIARPALRALWDGVPLTTLELATEGATLPGLPVREALVSQE